MTRFETIEVDVRGQLATVEFVRPERSNEVDSVWIREVTAAFTELAVDPRVRAVIIRARAGDFCGGMGASARDELGLDWFADWERALTTVENLPVPVVCAVSGRCVGAGLQLATVCDVRIATPDASFAATVHPARLVPGLSWWRLPRFLGVGRAKYLIMACSGVSAEQALQIGLIDEIADDAGQRAEQIAESLLDFAPTAFAETKRLMNSATTMSHDQAVAEFLVAELRCLGDGRQVSTPPEPGGGRPLGDPAAVAAVLAAQREAADTIPPLDPWAVAPATNFDPRW